MNLLVMARKIAGVIGARFAGAGIGFLSQLLLARIMPAADVGVVFMGMSAAAFVSLAANGGYSMVALTQLPKLALFRHGAPQKAFHQLALLDSLIMTVICCAIVLVAERIVPFSEGQNVALLFGCLCTPTASLIRYYSAIATSNRRYNVAFVPDFIVRPGILLAVILFAYVSGYTLSVIEVLVIFTVASLLTAIGQMWLLRDVGIPLKGLGFPRKSFAAALRSRAFALTVVSAALLASSDVVTLLSGFLLPAADVAVIGITMRLAALVGYVLQAGQQFVMPDFTQAVLKGDDETVDTLVLRINVMTIVMMLGAIGGAWLLGPWVLKIFGAEYTRGAHILVIFLVSQAVRALSGMNQHLLSIRGYQMRTAGACLLSLAILVLLAFMLSRSMGLEGMAYAVLLAEIAWLLLLAAQAQSLCKSRADIFWLLQKRLSGSR